MAVEQTRWGIIYCPKEGVRKTHKRWEAIQAYLKEKQVDYDFIQSESPDSVERLAGMLVANGYVTIIVVGGDTVLNRALNGMLMQEAEAHSRVALGVIPNGWANDFARYWGFEEDNYKQTIDWLVARRLRKVDVGFCRVLDADRRPTETVRYFLNCVNVGLVGGIMNLRHKTRRFWRVSALAYLSSLILLLFRRMENKVHLKVNQEEINRSAMNVCIGSGRGYGLTPGAVPYNGLLDVSVISHPGFTQLLEGVWMLFAGRFLNHKNVKAYRTRDKVVFYDCEKTTVSMDGFVWKEAVAPFEVGLQKEWVDFIIPS